MLLSGMRLTTRSMLPLWNRASLRFQWGLRVPPELKAALADDGYGRKAGSLAVSKLPLLVMNKITIEHTPRRHPKSEEDKKGKSAPIAQGEEFSLMKRQLEALNDESIMLRHTVEGLRAEIGASRAISVPSKGDARRMPATSPPLQNPFPVKPDLHGNGKELVASGPNDASEELKKALEVGRQCYSGGILVSLVAMIALCKWRHFGNLGVVSMCKCA
ncbi:unnamed protein product [Triticum turgidum subsp. durum]|uniref:Uncharacterized protein n=1 Tax=Triticum turgidum subsp. durum TaxID=4567 RepID=A0A9R0XBX1_TRITD|nr:unnamed protein product [Triticum turgidum subsp. durum]